MFTIITSIIGLVVSCLALIMSMRTNIITAREDYIKNYNLMSEAFDVWKLYAINNENYGRISDKIFEFSKIVFAAKNNAELLLNNEVIEPISKIFNLAHDLWGNFTTLTYHQQYMKNNPDDIDYDGKEQIRELKRKIETTISSITAIVFTDKYLVELYCKHTQLNLLNLIKILRI